MSPGRCTGPGVPAAFSLTPPYGTSILADSESRRMVIRQDPRSNRRATRPAPQRPRAARPTIDPSSNRTCGFPASGSPTVYPERHSADPTGRQASCQPGESRLLVEKPDRHGPIPLGHEVLLEFPYEPIQAVVAQLLHGLSVHASPDAMTGAPASPSTGITPLRRHHGRVRLLDVARRTSRVPGYSARRRSSPPTPRPPQYPNGTSPRADRLYAGGAEGSFPLYPALEEIAVCAAVE